MAYDTKRIIDASRRLLAKAKSDCGANKPGGGGFTIGNTCGSEGANVANANKETSGHGKWNDRIDTKAEQNWLMDKPVAYRIQAASKPIPTESQNRWSDDEETMPGTSAFANAGSGIRDIAIGKKDPETDENYAGLIESAGDEPLLIVLDGATSDAPGAEVLVSGGKIAAVINREEAREAVRKAVEHTYASNDEYDVSNVFTDSWEDFAYDWHEELDDEDSIYVEAEKILQSSRKR